MNEKELVRGLEEVRKAKELHPEASAVEWVASQRVEVKYVIYPEESSEYPF